MSNMLKMSDTPIRGFLPFFANVGLQVAFLVPTPTGYQKSIMDATLPLREMLREAGIHNYAEQKQGPKFKALVKTYYLRETILTRLWRNYDYYYRRSRFYRFKHCSGIRKAKL